MTSSRSSPKRTVKSYFEEISSFDLFYQLTYMSATSAAGITQSRIFQLARHLPCLTAQYFKGIHEVAENLRYNYPDAVRMIGEKVKSDEVKTFLLRLSDALRSGEPLVAFLAREAEVQGEHYTNDYARRLESLKKWNDAYTAITVSAALIVIINMVSTMIYNLGTGVMLMMVLVSVAASFGVAWVLFRSAPQEQVSVPLAQGSPAQRRSRKLFRRLIPAMLVTCLVLWIAGLGVGWILIAAGLWLIPIGWHSRKADNETAEKDKEISSFYRSLGGTATSRGTTLRVALASIKIDSFPALYSDIRMLNLRLNAFAKPVICWRSFGVETGSKLADLSTGVFYEAVNLGGDPEKSGVLTSEFAMKTAMLRAQRRGIGGTFAWLTIAMQVVLAALMVFLLVVLEQFSLRLSAASAALGDSTQAAGALGLQDMFAFSTPQIQFLSLITVGMVILLAVVNSFVIVATEGAHLIKMTYYLAMMTLLSGICFLVIPPFVQGII